jgi:type 1 glutamine amidotransferase
MATNLVISGGPGHDFETTSMALVALFAEQGVTSTVFDDPHEALAALTSAPDPWDVLTVNGLHWRMEPDRYADLRSRFACSLSDREAGTIEHHVRSGGGLLACHTAAICFDADPRWAACIGATWNWDRSSHPPQAPALVSPTAAASDHPLTTGIGAFTIVDEIYGFLDQDRDLVPLLTSAHGGASHPVLWTREVGRGRVVTDLLGHDASAMAHPEHHEILRRAVRWLTEPEARPVDPST